LRVFCIACVLRCVFYKNENKQTSVSKDYPNTKQASKQAK
jgi:hypothetical protein